MALIAAQQRRGSVNDITINNAAGDPITPGTNDQIRAIIGRLAELGGTATDPTGFKLLVASNAPTDNGSIFTKGSAGPPVVPNRLRLDAQDLTFEAGVYTLLIEFFDNADAQEWKQVDRQVFDLAET